MLADYQLDAVDRCAAAIERYGGVLLADAPGLGKSLVASEVARRYGSAIELIIPVGLLHQWRDTLERFGVEAVIRTHDEIANLPFVAQPAERRLLIVDEAHAFRNPATRRYAALCRRSVASDLLLLTATPLCNSVADLEALLRLVAADDVLAGRGVPSIDLAFHSRDAGQLAVILSELMVRRGRDVVPESLRFATLRPHVIRHGVPPLSIDQLEFPLVGGLPLLRRLLRRRLESSEAALIESLRRQRRFYERVLESGRPMSKRDYRLAFAREEDADAFQEVLFWDLWAPSAELDVPAVERELKRLDLLRAAAAAQGGTKIGLLRDALAGRNAPAIIFTAAAATAHYVGRELGCGVATARTGRGAVEAFRRGQIDILVATDLVSEGLDLQRAGVIVHFDLPWNPAKIEQRNGRACRIGQRRQSVEVFYFVPYGDDSGIVRVLTKKNRVRRDLFGPRAVDEVPQLVSTLRTRLVAGSPAVRFCAAAERRGFTLPERIERRHRAGVEQLLDSMSREYLDARRMDDLLAILAAER